MPERWTVRRVVDWMTRDFENRGLASPRLDADLLVAHALGVERVTLYMDLDRPLSPPELVAVRALVERRRRREPIAYIRGRREFWGRTFEVGPAVLVPRPDTETLVEQALRRLPADAPARALDLCTGSGAIAVTLAAERTSLEVDATDVSAAALRIAEANVARHELTDRVRLFEGDLYDPLPAGVRYDLVVANPPYVAERELASLEPDVTEHEPRVALVAGPDGLAVIRRIVEGVADRLRSGGALLFEVGATQAAAARELIRSRPQLEDPVVHRDLAGLERVVETALR